MYLPMNLFGSFTNSDLLIKQVHTAMYSYGFVLFFFIISNFSKTLLKLRSLSIQDLMRYIMPSLLKSILQCLSWRFLPGGSYMYCSDFDTRWVVLHSMNLSIMPFAFMCRGFFVNFCWFVGCYVKMDRSLLVWPFLVNMVNGLFCFYFSNINMV